MAVRLETETRKRYVGTSAGRKPFVGTQADGTVLAASDLPTGSLFFEEDTGKEYRWNSVAWTLPLAAEDVPNETLNELRAIRVGIEWLLFAAHDIKIDLRTETIVETKDNG